MAGQSTLRTLGTKYGAKTHTNGKSVQLTSAKWNCLLVDLQTAMNGQTQAEKQNKNVAAENRKLTTENAKLVEENDHLTEELEELREQLKEQASESSKKKRGRGKKAVICRKDEQKDDVKKAVTEHIKDVLFRTHKFALPGDALKGATKLVWVAIKDGLKLDKGPNAITEEDFIEIYESLVLSVLSDRRQYAQTRCKKAADGTDFV